MQIRLNKLDFTELYFSGNKVDALQGIFNGQPGSYKPRRLFCIQFALCLHTYKSKIKGWRADGGALSLPSYCWFSCCVVWRRLGVGSSPARSPQQLISSIHTYQSIDNIVMCIRYFINRQSTCVFVIRFLDIRRGNTLLDRSTIDTCIRVSISRQSTCTFVIRLIDSWRVHSLFGCSTIDLWIRYSIARQ